MGICRSTEGAWHRDNWALFSLTFSSILSFVIRHTPVIRLLISTLVSRCRVPDARYLHIPPLVLLPLCGMTSPTAQDTCTAPHAVQHDV